MPISPKAARVTRHQGDTYDFVANLNQLGVPFPGTIVSANLSVSSEIPPESGGPLIDIDVASPPSSSITFPISALDAALPVGEYIAQVQIIDDTTGGGAIYTSPAFFWEILPQMKS
jgi:hypothetical protein